MSNSTLFLFNHQFNTNLLITVKIDIILCPLKAMSVQKTKLVVL